MMIIISIVIDLFYYHKFFDPYYLHSYSKDLELLVLIMYKHDLKIFEFLNLCEMNCWLLNELWSQF